MSSFRSVAPLLRTARFSLRAGYAVNPLQHALKRQNAAGILNFTRGYAAEFKRDKPHVNIGKDLDAPCLCRSTQVSLTQLFRYYRPRRSRKGKALSSSRFSRDAYRATVHRVVLNLMCFRRLSLRPSPRGKPRRASPASSTTAPSIGLPRRGSVVSPSPPRISSTPPKAGITRTSTALVTPITSRT